MSNADYDSVVATSTDIPSCAFGMGHFSLKKKKKKFVRTKTPYPTIKGTTQDTKFKNI